MAVPILAEVLKPVRYGGEGMLDAMLGVGSTVLEETVAPVDERTVDDDGDDEMGGGRVEGTVG